MAKIVISGTIVQYPLGGMTQWVIAWLIGFKKNGHQVTFVEKEALWEYSYYDVEKRIMSNDPTYGLNFIKSTFERFGLENCWSFVGFGNEYYGLSSNKVKRIFSEADIFIDLEWGSWEPESLNIPIRIFFDGETGWFQIKLQNMIHRGETLSSYTYYFTHGQNIGKPCCPVPTAGIKWLHTFSPVLILESQNLKGVRKSNTFTTVMNWQSEKRIEYNGKIFGQKDMEFEKFIELPSLVDVQMEVAVSGPNVPIDRLKKYGWRVVNADDISQSVDSYLQYIRSSFGEFSIMKNVFVENDTGGFGDRAGYYLQMGRPSIVQETGWSAYLPNGDGIFAVKDNSDAIAAISEINANYEYHSKKAIEIANEYLDAKKVIKRMLDQIGI